MQACGDRGHLCRDTVPLLEQLVQLVDLELLSSVDSGARRRGVVGIGGRRLVVLVETVQLCELLLQECHARDVEQRELALELADGTQQATGHDVRRVTRATTIIRERLFDTRQATLERHQLAAAAALIAR